MGIPSSVHPLTNHTTTIENNFGMMKWRFPFRFMIMPRLNYQETSLSLVRNWTIDPILPSAENGSIGFASIFLLPIGLNFNTIKNASGIVEAGHDHTCTILDNGSLNVGGMEQKDNLDKEIARLLYASSC